MAARSRSAPTSRKRLARARLKVIGGATVVGGLVLAAVFAPLPHSPTTPNELATYLPPSGRYWFGTDGAGIDVFSRTIAAAKTDVPIALAGVLIAGLIGTPLGVLLSVRNRVTESAMRVVDLFQALPLLIVTVVIVAIWSNGGGAYAVIIAIAFANTPVFLRVVRAESLTVRARRFVEAAEGFGASSWRVATRHIMPNVAPIVLAQLSISCGFAIIVIAALGYLGIGVHPPTPTWGSMIFQGAQVVGDGDWWLLTFPALAICLMVICLNLIADGVRGMLAHSGDVGHHGRSWRVRRVWPVARLGVATTEAQGAE